MNRHAWLVFLLAALAFPARADSDSKPLLDRAAVIRAAAGVTREKYPNADDVLVDDHIRVRYHADGTSETRDDTYVKTLTEKGKRENQTLAFHFTLPYGTVRCAILEIIKPDGTVVPVDVDAQSRVMVDRGQMGSNIYNPNNKILRVGVPGLDIGDTVHYLSVRKTVKTRMPDTWSDWQVLEYTSPIRRFVFEVIGPAALPLRRIGLRDALKDRVTYRRSEQDGLVRHRWEAADVPRMYAEPSMPPLHTVVQRLLVSTIPDWETISKWYWGISAPHLATTPAIRDRVAKLTKGIAGRKEKIEAIFRFVSQKIRYMGITTEKEAPGYEPHDVAITFENKYGVCRDKAALLVAMLREAGLPAYPVLIHNGPKKDPEIPQPYFNHAIVAVGNPDGSYLLMDPTDENTTDLLPAYLCHQSYLVARPEGETLRTSPIIPASENLVRVETTGDLRANGDLELRTVMRFHGINDNAYRGYFARVKPEERKLFFERRAKRLVPGARVTRFRIEPADVQDTSTPLVLYLDIVARDALVSDGRTAMLPIPRWGARVGVANFILGRAGLKKRKYPFQTDIACGVSESLSIRIADALGESLALPDYAQIDDDIIQWKQSLARDGDRLVGESVFQIKGVEFSPAQYLRLREHLRTMEYSKRKMPVFARRRARRAHTPAGNAGEEPAGSPDAVVLEARIDYVLKDESAWTETRTFKKRILSYAGKKTHAEMKLNYNPAWEEVKILDARVTAPDGTVKQVRKEEMNLMDAGWAGAAPRYPAAKTLVVSLPNVDVGSVIAYRVARVKKDRPFFAMRQYFRGFDPLKRKCVTVRAPEALRKSIRTRLWGGVKPSVEGDAWVWTAVDQPAVKREPNLPPWWVFAPRVILSAGEWDGYADRVRAALVKASASLSGDALPALRAGSPREKTVAIRDWVARNIRPAGPALHELPLTAISAADVVRVDGYGNSADRAVLLYALLERAGMKPAFVLASGERRVARLASPLVDRPDPSVFGSVLVRVKVEGDTIYLNDTDQYAALGATRHDGCYGLDLNTGKIFEIRAPDKMRDGAETIYVIAVKADGNAEITRTRRFHGTAFGSRHRFYREMPPEERRRHHQEIVAQIANAADPVGPLKTSFESYPGAETLTVAVKRFAVRDGKYLYLRLPRSLARLPGAWSDTREGPLFWPAPIRDTVRTTVRLPKGFEDVVLVPVSEKQRLKRRLDARLTARVRRGGRVEIVHTLATSPSVTLTKDYGTLMEISRRLQHPRGQMILARTR